MLKESDNLKFDAVCRKCAVLILLCAAVLLICGAVSGTVSAAVGDIAACTAVSLYVYAFAHALVKAVSEDISEYAEFVKRSGRIFLISYTAAHAVKLFFLTLPSYGAENIARWVLIADALISWLPVLKLSEKHRAEFLERERKKEVLCRVNFFGED